MAPATLCFRPRRWGINEDNVSGRRFGASSWSNATPIRRSSRRHSPAGLAYANPHSFRKTLAQLGERVCRTPEEFKAWSQNLGHEQVLTTFSSYGQVADDRQAELIRGLGRTDSHPLKGEAIDQVMRFLENARHHPH